MLKIFQALFWDNRTILLLELAGEVAHGPELGQYGLFWVQPSAPDPPPKRIVQIFHSYINAFVFSIGYTCLFQRFIEICTSIGCMYV